MTPWDKFTQGWFDLSWSFVTMTLDALNLIAWILLFPVRWINKA